MSDIRDNWTRDAQGNFVDWTKPPYKVPRSGIICLVLEGEGREDMTPEIHSKRLAEYSTLVKRDIQRRRVQNQKRPGTE